MLRVFLPMIFFSLTRGCKLNAVPGKEHYYTRPGSYYSAVGHLVRALKK